MKCSICQLEIEAEAISGWDKGHNAQPVNDGRCCTSCNDNIVIPARINQHVTRNREPEKVKVTVK
jgi:hypothetical protein